MNTKYGLFGKFTAHEGKRDELVAILLEAAATLERTNPDCLQYIVGVSPEGGDDIWISEVWTSKEAHDASLAPEEVRNQIMRARPLIKEIPGGTEYAVVGGKGA